VEQAAGADAVASAVVGAVAVRAVAGAVVAVGAEEAEVAAIVVTAVAAEAAIAAGNRTAQFGKQSMSRGAHFAPRFFFVAPFRSLLVKCPRWVHSNNGMYTNSTILTPVFTVTCG
jgi:hypothetical protein